MSEMQLGYLRTFGVFSIFQIRIHSVFLLVDVEELIICRQLVIFSCCCEQTWIRLRLNFQYWPFQGDACEVENRITWAHSWSWRWSPVQANFNENFSNSNFRTCCLSLVRRWVKFGIKEMIYLTHTCTHTSAPLRSDRMIDGLRWTYYEIFSCCVDLSTHPFYVCFCLGIGAKNIPSFISYGRCLSSTIYASRK